MLQRRQARSARFAIVFLLTAAILAIVSAGCVRRRITVRTNPPGALVYIDDQEIGTTPVSSSFVYYGTRKIRLVKDGYETLTVLQTFRPPWYQLPPLDFVAENFSTWEHRDERVLDFQLVPQVIVPTRHLLERATNLRQGSRQGFLAPLPAMPAEQPAGQTPSSP